MEGDLGLGLVLLAVLFFGWGGLFMWRRFGREEGAVNPTGAYPGDPRVRIMGKVLDAVTRSITSNLERTEMSYHSGDPADTITLIMDIEQFRHLRKHRGVWQHQGIFYEREVERRWARRPPAMREWEGMELVVPIAIRAAFDADPTMRIVRFWTGDMENHALTICRVSVEAKRGQSPAGFDWRFDKRAKGYLAPVTPHGDRLPSLAAVGLAEDPYDFEQQVAQMLRGRGLTVEVTGGTGDEGVDIIAHDDTPVTGGVYLIQCKRYSPDKKVGVAEVRELYGTMQEKQSAKGVLVTSSTFTAGALKFAEGKSIELIDGARLSELLVGTEQPMRPMHPMESIRPAKPTQPVPDAFLQAEYDFSGPASEESQEKQLARMTEEWLRRFELGREREPLLTDPSLITPALWESMDPSIRQMGDTATALNQANFFVGVNEDDAHVLIEAIKNGADPNHTLENGTNALILAASHGHTGILGILAAYGADINKPFSAEGLTVLHFAVGMSRLGVVRQLLATGADMNALTREGHSPLDVSISRLLEPDFNQGDVDIIQALVGAGADTKAAYELAIQMGLDKSDAARGVLDLLRPP